MKAHVLGTDGSATTEKWVFTAMQDHAELVYMFVMLQGAARGRKKSH